MNTKDILYELRTKHGLSQDELAEKVFVTRQAVSRWETGETVPNTETLKLLSNLFHVSINTLLGSPQKLVCQCCGMPLEDAILSKNKDGTIKTVTVKIWMECPTTGGAANTVSGVDISSININLVSSWGKTRRIFVHDDTVSEWDAVLNNGENNATGAQWLTNDSNAVLYWALEDSSTNEGYRPFSIKPAPASGDPYVSIAAVSNQSHWFYMDIPAVYNNRSTALFRTLAFFERS